MGDAGIANKHALSHRVTQEKIEMRQRRVEKEHSSTAAGERESKRLPGCME